MFSQEIDGLPLEALVRQSLDTTGRTLGPVLTKGRAETLADFAALVSPAAGDALEKLAAGSQQITLKHFGRTMRMFAPLYLSNECINVCKYCGFSRTNPIPRITLPVQRVVEEAELLAGQGFRSILLVSGEHPKYVNNGYMAECIRRVLPVMPSVAIEVAPMETADYVPLVEAGAEGVVVYQETYDEPTYREMHPMGPKKDYRWRLDTPERAYAAGFRRIGIGALLGLADWRREAIAVAAHARYLLQRCWKAQITLAFPRLRPAAGGFEPEARFVQSDREFVQLLCALRWFLPHAGLVLSTREKPDLRDGLIPLGLTMMSAGSSTEPGGYSHFDESNWTPTQAQEGEQFHISDERAPAVVARAIRDRGYEPVWKDFDQSLAGIAAS